MTDQERIEHYEEALRRISMPIAFHLPTSKVDPESYARMIYAEAVLDGLTLERASQKAEYETRRRYAISPTCHGISEEAYQRAKVLSAIKLLDIDERRKDD